MSAFTEAFKRGMHGMEAVSTGTCPGCEACMEIDGCDDVEAHRMKWSSSDCASGETHFSWSPCGICGTKFGGDRHAWHWIDPNDPKREIHHEDDVCTDCVLYLANGDEPENWRAR